MTDTLTKYIHRVRAKHAEIFFDGTAFIKVVLDDDVEIEMEDVLEQRKICYDFCKGKPHVLLAVAGKRTSATKEVREYSSKNIPEGRVAEGIIIKSLPVRLMGNVYINFNKPGVPTKMFEEEQSAEEWLNQMLNEKGIM